MKNKCPVIEDARPSINNKFIDYAGLFLIGILFLGYLLYYSSFAKLHIDFSFISVPIFISEIIFIICICLFFLKWLLSHKKLGILTYLFLFYFTFVAVKTLLGYFYWGPLALRHSALFLYPLFGVFSYSFYRNVFSKSGKILSCIFIFIIIFVFFKFHNYFTLTCFALTIILIRAYPKSLVRRILYILLLLTFPYKSIFLTSRTFIVSNLLIAIYMFFGFLYVSKIKNKYKFIIFVFFVLFISFGIIKISNPHEVGSLVGLKELIKRYNVQTEVLRLKEPTFVERKLQVKLYNEKNSWNEKIESPFVISKEVSDNSVRSVKENNLKVASKVESEKKIVPSIYSNRLRDNNKEKKDVGLKKTREPSYVDPLDRGIDVPYGNSLFRIFIWKDVFSQLTVKRPILGFSFGEPFRSRSLEILNWGTSEWSKDGWVCLHNSYIDIVYRAGIIGILIDIFIILMCFFIAVTSFRNRSLTGILLSGILFNWFVAANFLEILEMPYTAIPLWSLTGLTLAYLFKKKSK